METLNIRLHNPQASAYNRRISAEEWSKYENQVRLWHAESLSRHEMLARLHDQHSFSPTLSQFQVQMRRWGLRVYQRSNRVLGPSSQSIQLLAKIYQAESSFLQAWPLDPRLNTSTSSRSHQAIDELTTIANFLRAAGLLGHAFDLFFIALQSAVGCDRPNHEILELGIHCIRTCTTDEQLNVAIKLLSCCSRKSNIDQTRQRSGTDFQSWFDLIVFAGLVEDVFMVPEDNDRPWLLQLSLCVESSYLMESAIRLSKTSKTQEQSLCRPLIEDGFLPAIDRFLTDDTLRRLIEWCRLASTDSGSHSPICRLGNVRLEQVPRLHAVLVYSMLWHAVIKEYSTQDSEFNLFKELRPFIGEIIAVVTRMLLSVGCHDFAPGNGHYFGDSHVNMSECIESRVFHLCSTDSSSRFLKQHFMHAVLEVLHNPLWTKQFQSAEAHKILLANSSNFITTLRSEPGEVKSELEDPPSPVAAEMRASLTNGESPWSQAPLLGPMLFTPTSSIAPTTPSERSMRRLASRINGNIGKSLQLPASLTASLNAMSLSPSDSDNGLLRNGGFSANTPSSSMSVDRLPASISS